MRKLLAICALALFTTACSTRETGLDYVTFPAISNVVAQPAVVTDKDRVTVTADVKNLYGSFKVYIYYRVGNGPFTTTPSQEFEPTEETVHYEGWIPAQPAGSTVEWVVRCLNNPYGLLQQTEVRSYRVVESDSSED